MYSFEATGAGDVTYNGTYIFSGYYNGRPSYTNYGSRWLWYDLDSEVWILSPAKGDVDVPYLSIEHVTLPANPWYVNTGIAPAPTLEDIGPWIVDGAGDNDYNGVYNRSGSYNGHSAYTNGSMWLFYDPFSWILNPTKTLDISSFHGVYRGAPSDEVLPSTWHIPLEGTGIAPAPTVAEIEGWVFPWWWLLDSYEIPTWRQVASNSSGECLVACTSMGPRLAPAAGDVFRSQNYGVQWTSIKPTTAPFFAIALDSDGSNVIVGGTRLYTSSNTGASWTERKPAGDIDIIWLAVASDADGSNLIAAASGGRLYTSGDSGLHWTERQPGGDVNLGWVAVDSDATGLNLIAAATGGRLYTSGDSGATWTERQPGGAMNLYWSSVASDDDGSNLIACVYGGRLYMSVNSGVDWSEPQPAGAANEQWTCVSSDADGSKLIAGIRGGAIYSSADSGGAWGTMDIMGVTTVDWNSVASSSGGSVVVCDEGSAGSGPFIGTTETGLFVSWDGGVDWPTYAYRGAAALALYGQGEPTITTNTALHGAAALGLYGQGEPTITTGVSIHGAAAFSIGSSGVAGSNHTGNGYWFRDLAGTWINGDGFYAPVLPHVGSMVFRDVFVSMLPKVANGFIVKLAILNRPLVPSTPSNLDDYSEISRDIPAMVHLRLKFNMTVDGVFHDVYYSKILVLSTTGAWLDNAFRLGPADTWVPAIDDTLVGHAVTTVQLLQTRVDFQPAYKEWHKSGYTNPRMVTLLSDGDWWSTLMGSWHSGDGNTWCSQASILNVDSLRLFYI